MKYVFLVFGAIAAILAFILSANHENPVGMALAAIALMIGGIIGGQHDLAVVIRQSFMRQQPQQPPVPQAHQYPQQQPHTGPQYGQHR